MLTQAEQEARAALFAPLPARPAGAPLDEAAILFFDDHEDEDVDVVDELEDDNVTGDDPGTAAA